MGDIVKAGWLHRQTKILKNWKKQWFTLSNDGRLRYFDSPDKQFDVADDVFFLNKCKEIKAGGQIDPSLKIPLEFSTQQVFQIISNDNSVWTLIAESEDDVMAWQLAFEEVRRLHVQRLQQTGVIPTNFSIPANHYVLNYPGEYDGEYPHQVYMGPDGRTHTVVFVDRSRYYHGDAALGAFTGLAIGSLLFWPLFWPIWWC
ncbi:unnamed protein product [Didymodactylos carnosus]|uniref:PH domain-containing protein n=1 Tax=Didymodactylos carnosus TaxID=1234261 RepID=A0A815BD64_9BILA|nr:unnamed protein product [Didymodactylos carnosus]CAF4052709.1 unnamed protein product [Didymodactylos carnosus]